MPAPDRQSVVSMLFEAIDAANQQLPAGKRIEKSEAIALMGPGSPVESLSLMGIVVDLEERLAERYGVDILLADLLGLPLEQNPFRSVGALADDLAARIQAASFIRS